MSLVAFISRHRRRASVPRILFGITPIINLKYWSRALRDRGYISDSFVYGVYAINRREDFDHTLESVFPRASRLPGWGLVGPYAALAWALRRYDVFVLDFDGGFLRDTPLKFAELPLMRRARKAIIAIPYGGDATDIRRARSAATQISYQLDYPGSGQDAERVARRVRHYSKWASLIVAGGHMVDFLDRFDVLVPSMLALDTQEWRLDKVAPGREPPTAPSPFVILHAPNHRRVKGTDHLVRAIDDLRAEGVPVELKILERVPNSVIREEMAKSDAVASAFVSGYYELFAIEGMSMGKPVLNYWRPDLKQIYSDYSFASECPIVDTPVEKIKENVRRLVGDPDLCLRLGQAGRRYVERHHSYAAFGDFFEDLVRRAWDP